MNLSFECILPREEEGRLLMAWRNDPVSRKMSYHTEMKVWETFFKEFCDTYYSIRELPPLFILYNDIIAPDH